MNRREAIRALGGAVLSVGVAGQLGARGRGDRLERIGLQLYTVRGEMGRDFEGTLARVADVGYREVEFAGYFGRRPPAVRAALDAAGLAAPSAHVPFPALRNRWEEVLESALVMGHRYLVVAWIPEEERRTIEGYRAVAQLYNRAGEAARAGGLEYAYHNHDFEFQPLEGQVPYDVLMEHTDAELVRFELDLYWVTKGRGDPLAYFSRHPGRFPLVHVKDMDATPERGMVDVGRGTIDFGRIFAKRAEAGIRHFFVEHDQPPSPFDSIRASYDYLARLEF